MERYLKNVLGSSKFVGVEEKRSQTMGAIRGKGNRTTEVALRMAMIRAGIAGWTMHPTDIPGKPDFFFEANRLAIFVDGCFWHGCKRCGHTPKTRSKFWAAKIERNKARDSRINLTLRQGGIRILRIWEHELKLKNGRQTSMAKLSALLRNKKSFSK